MLRILGSASAQHYLDLDGVPVRADAAVVLSLAPNTHTMLRVALPGRWKHLTESFPCLHVGEFACLVCLLHALELDAVEDERAELEIVGACGRSRVQLTRRFETAGASHSEWKQAGVVSSVRRQARAILIHCLLYVPHAVRFLSTC